MPKHWGYPAPREREGPARVAHVSRFGRYKRTFFTLAASTAFQEVVTFAGRPDRISILYAEVTLEFRLRNRGQPPGDTITNFASDNLTLQLIGADTVEVRDPSGVGGFTVQVIALYEQAPVSEGGAPMTEWNA